jgi:hypothetical protein
LGVNYGDIIRERKTEQPANLDYFLGELVKIEVVKKKLMQLLSSEKK